MRCGIYVRVSTDDQKEEKIIKIIFSSFCFFEYGNKIYVQPALNLYSHTNSTMGTPIPFNGNNIINLQIISIINCNLYVLKIYFIKK